MMRGQMGKLASDDRNIVSDVAGGRIDGLLAAELGRRTVPKAGRTRVVAIDGRSGAGKTSLAAALRSELDAPVVTLEDLYGGWDGLKRGIDLLVSEVLEPLGAGRAALVPRYDWVTEAWGTPWVLEPPEILIVEGVGAGALRAAAYASTLVWMQAAASVRKKRALDRDGETFAPYWDMWARQEDAMLAREHTPDRADIVIDAVNGKVVAVAQR
jgi:uridine kinase